VWREIKQDSVISSVVKLAALSLKVLCTGLLWLPPPPLLLGLLLEAVILIPLRTPLYETPQYSFLQCWAIGLILLKVWVGVGMRKSYTTPSICILMYFTPSL